MSRHDKQLRRARRREKRHTRSKPWKQRFAMTDEPVEVHLLSYDITTEPLRDLPIPGCRQLHDVIGDDASDQLHEEVFDNPRAAIARLERLIDQFPDVPILYNWLAMAYTRTADHARAEQLIRSNYQRNPAYLFARVNYAQLCLDDGQIDLAAQVMDHKFDLKLLFPERNLFHLTEFLAMSTLASSYALATGDLDTARRILDIMEDLAPDYEQTLTVPRRVEGSALMRILRKLARTVRPGV